MIATHLEDDECFLSLYFKPTTRSGTKGDAKAAEDIAPIPEEIMAFTVYKC